MKSWIVIGLLALGSARAAAAPAPESFLVNGLKVIVLPSTATDIITTNMYFRGGAAVAGTSRAGIERLALVVATRATRNFPKDRLSAALESMNTILASNAGADYSSITMQCVRQNLQESWKIFADVLLNPLFDSVDVERERQRTLAAIRQVQDNPDQLLDRLGREAFYGQRPASINPLGTEGSVRMYSAQDLREYMQSRRLASDMLLVVVGNTTRSEVEAMARGTLGALPGGSLHIQVDSEPVRHLAPSVKIVERKLPTNYIIGLFPAPSLVTEESYAMRIGRSILRDRVWEEVRTKRSLSYAPSSTGGGQFSDYAGIYVTAVKPETTITVMMDEVRKLQDQPVPTKTLDDTKNFFITQYYLTLETNSSQAEALARYELSGKGYQEALNLIERVRAVTPEQVQKVWKEYAHNLQFVIIGSPGVIQLAPFMY